MQNLKELLEKKYGINENHLNEDNKVNETVIKYKRADSRKIAMLILKALQESEQVFEEVKICEESRNLEIKDTEGNEYKIWISSDRY